MTLKTLDNTTADQAKDRIPDLKIWGNADMFTLLCKASSESERWMKSTKALEIPNVGCIVQVTTQQDGNVAEALTFVPGVRIIESAADADHGVTERHLVSIVDYPE